MRISKKTKSIISGILLVAIIAGVLALAGSLLGKETKTISSTEFSVGGINAQGNYVESKTSIYTKDMFECQGLTIEPDFEATGTYQVFYYDENKNFMGATEDFNAADGVYTKGSAFPFAVYARIMITPAVPTDEDGNIEENFKIRFYEVVGYANDYTITVNKKQVIDIVKIFNEQENKAKLLGEGSCTPLDGNFTAGSTGVYWYDRVDVENANTVVLKLKEKTLTNSVNVGSTEFVFPTLYVYGDGRAVLTDYEVLASVGGYVYVTFDVSGWDSAILYSDVNSVDILEMIVV